MTFPLLLLGRELIAFWRVAKGLGRHAIIQRGNRNRPAFASNNETKILFTSQDGMGILFLTHEINRQHGRKL
jgi:hypothetical protein